MVEESIDKLKEEFVGKTYTAVDRFPIEAGKIAEFAESIKEDNPVYIDTTGEIARENGYADVPAPPTYMMASSFFQRRQDVEGRPDLGFDLERVLHGEQSFEYERVPVAGDVLSAEGEVVDIYQREGSRGGTMTFAEFETTYYDQNDDPVVRESSTIIETGERPQE